MAKKTKAVNNYKEVGDLLGITRQRVYAHNKTDANSILASVVRYLLHLNRQRFEAITNSKNNILSKYKEADIDNATKRGVLLLAHLDPSGLENCAAEVNHEQFTVGQIVIERETLMPYKILSYDAKSTTAQVESVVDGRKLKLRRFDFKLL